MVSCDNIEHVPVDCSKVMTMATFIPLFETLRLPVHRLVGEWERANLYYVHAELARPQMRILSL